MRLLRAGQLGASSGFKPFMDQCEGSVEGLLSIQRGCVYFDGIRGGLQGGHGAIGVLRVAVADFSFHLGGVSGDTAGGEFQKTPAGAFGHTCGDEKLHWRIGENHSADIPPIQHGALSGAEAALEIEQGSAHGGDGGDLAGGHVGQGAAQIAAREVFGRERASFGFSHAGILGVYAAIQHAPANGAIEQAGIEVRQAKFGCQAAGQRALARGGRAINRYH